MVSKFNAFMFASSSCNFDQKNSATGIDGYF